jgi:hypothetical protein
LADFGLQACPFVLVLLNQFRQRYDFFVLGREAAEVNVVTAVNHVLGRAAPGLFETVS